jgi:large subunit ribosomal protein L3
MNMTVVGQKVGMTRVFDDKGASIPVTVVEILKQQVVQIKTVANEGYDALQVSHGVKKAQKVKKPQKGHFEKAGVEAGEGLFEVKVENIADFKVGDEIDLSFLAEQKFVDVTGTSKGKGYAGVIKRHNFKTQDATHGNSLSHRAPGSIGQNQSPGKVFKGKKMAGRMGGVRKTVHSLPVVRFDSEKQLLLIHGPIPGCKGSKVFIKNAVKKINGGE